MMVGEHSGGCTYDLLPSAVYLPSMGHEILLVPHTILVSFDGFWTLCCVSLLLRPTYGRSIEAIYEDLSPQ